MTARPGGADWDALIAAHAELGALPAGLRRHAQAVAAAAGETIFRGGARPRRMYWVVQGELRLVRRAANGAEIVLQRAASGFVAEASVESPRYHCDAVMAAPGRLLAFPMAEFREALRRDEGFRDFWMSRLARELRTSRAQCERLNLRSAADRIEHYIEAEGREGRLELRRSRKAWAAELGLTHEALYRALADLRRAGRLVTVQTKDALVLKLR